MGFYNLVSLGGIVGLLFLGWIFSKNRRRVRPRTILVGTLIQILFGAFIFWVPLGRRLFLFLNDFVVKVLDAAYEGARFCFGPLAIPPGQEGSLGFVLVTQALPSIVFFAALMEILYFIRVMPFIIRLFARFFSRLMGVSGAESLCTATNIFVGIESATTILPYLKNMTTSELFVVLTSGMGTIASSMLGLYVILLNQTFPQIAGHLVSASLLAAPAVLVMSKLFFPETGKPETLGRDVPLHYEKPSGLMEGIIRGAMAGGKMVFGIVVLLLAFLSLVGLVNLGLGGLGVKLQQLLAYPFYPLSLMIGVPPADAMEVAQLLGERLILSEVVAYQHLRDLIAGNLLESGRSAILASYALCGFAHLASVAIFVGGTAALCPERTRDLAAVAFRALVAATFTCLMTACVAGIFYGKGSLLGGF